MQINFLFFSFKYDYIKECMYLLSKKNKWKITQLNIIIRENFKKMKWYCLHFLCFLVLIFVKIKNLIIYEQISKKYMKI